MDNGNSSKSSGTPPCPWGAPVKATATWGSPLPSSSSNSSPNSQGSPHGSSFQGNRTPTYRHQRPGPYQGPHRMQNASPFQNRGQFGSPFRNRGQISSPSQFQQRPRYHSSPLDSSTPSHTPRKDFQSPHNNFSPSPSPRQGFNPNHSNSGNKRFMNNSRGGYSQDQYANPNMLVDPWRDMPAKPLLTTY